MVSARWGPESSVTLISLSQQHAEATFRWVADPVIARNVGIRARVSLKSTRQWVADAGGDDTRLAFAITLDDRHVGNVVLDQIDRAAGTARLSIYIGEPDARGRGIGQQAVRLAMDEAFDTQGLGRVWLIVHAGNAPAIAAYQRAGFTTEDVIPEEFLLGDRRVDALRMAVMRESHRP